jgi:hypothetical protein
MQRRQQPHSSSSEQKGEKRTMRKAIRTLKTRAACAAARTRAILKNEAGDFYISDGVKIIIAVVLGALLLAALTLIFNDTVIPRITREIEGLFGP